jgi:hypothetical protein
LEKLGPETKSLLGLGGSSSWPSDETVEDFRGAVSFESANGGEIGKSEVIVLAAKSSSPERASKFLSLLLDEVDSKLSEVRANRFESMEAELRATCESNLQSRKTLVNELIAMEAKIGSDIGLVRSLIEPSMGSPSAFEEERNQVLLEQRTAIQERDMAMMLRDSLRESARKSLDEIPTSAELLTMQPQLADLIAGLAVAKQNLSEQEGRYTSRHGLVRAAKERVESLRRQIKSSLPLAISGLNNQIRARDEVVNKKTRALEKMQETQTRVSKYRVHYATASQELEKQTGDLSDAKARLARMQARKMASGSIKLLTRIGEPWTGTKSDGLGKRALALAGGLGGLLIGLGLVMIVAPPYTEPDAHQAAQVTEVDEETVSEQRLAQQLSDVLPQRSDAKAPSAPVAPPQYPVVDQAPSPPVTEPPLRPDPAAVPVQTSTDAQKLAETVSSTLTENVTPPATAPVMTAGAVAAAAATASVASGFESVAPVDLEPEFSVVETETTTPTLPTMAMDAPATAEAAYLTPTPRTNEESGSQVAPVQYPATQQPVSTAPPSHPAIPDQSQATRPASQTLAAIFANMPQPKTDIGVDDSDEELEKDAEASVSSNRIADRILDVTDQQLSETRVPEPQVEDQTASNSNIRQPVDTIQLGASSIVPQSDAIPLQRRASYRPVDLARVEDGDEQSGTEEASLSGETQDAADQPELSERSIDSVFSQLQNPESRRVEPTTTYDPTNPDQA